MAKSLIDKVFFIDKIDDHGAIIDFGCGDGTLTAFLASLFPNTEFYAFDKNPEMAALATENFKDIPNAKVLPSFVQVDDHAGHCSILLSSVIHEIYSYGGDSVQSFWNRIFSIRPNYLIIRDMCVSKSTSRPSDPISVAKVRQFGDTDKIAQWESKWGSLDENWSLVHYLLTYHYDENWEREYQENYLPIAFENLLSLMPSHYEPHFIEHYTLPYIRNKVDRDYGVQLQDRTHLKLIMKRTP